MPCKKTVQGVRMQLQRTNVKNAEAVPHSKSRWYLKYDGKARNAPTKSAKFAHLIRITEMCIHVTDLTFTRFSSTEPRGLEKDFE
jgi:hypothetical protein